MFTIISMCSFLKLHFWGWYKTILIAYCCPSTYIGDKECSSTLFVPYTNVAVNTVLLALCVFMTAQRVLLTADTKLQVGGHYALQRQLSLCLKCWMLILRLVATIALRASCKSNSILTLCWQWPHWHHVVAQVTLLETYGETSDEAIPQDSLETMQHS